MPVDTSRTIEIENSPTKLLVLCGAGVLMAVGGAAVAFGWLSGFEANAYARFIGYVCLVFFGFCVLAALWRLLTVRGPVITISPMGIRDTRVASDIIPWSAVTGISTWTFKRQKIMILAVDRATEAKLTLTRMARWTRDANRALGADGLAIGAQGVKIDHDTLVATATAYLQAHRAAGTRTGMSFAVEEL